MTAPPSLARRGVLVRADLSPGLSGAAPNPQAGNLTFFYAKRPTDPATLATTLDALWTEQFNELLILEVAIYLALEGRPARRARPLMEARDKWANLFVAFLEHETANERRRFGHVARINVRTVIPAYSLLAGGPPPNTKID
jgi:hypothetical protein